MVNVSTNRYVPGPVQAVWDVYTELEGWTYWAGVGIVTLEREGRTETNGVGAIRSIDLVGPAIREEVVRFEPPHHFAYTVLSGVPVKGHLGEVTLESEGVGTRITWSVRFEPRVLGTGGLLKRIIRRALDSILSQLANRMADDATHRAQCPYSPDKRHQPHPLARLAGAIRDRIPLLPARPKRIEAKRHGHPAERC